MSRFPLILRSSLIAMALIGPGAGVAADPARVGDEFRQALVRLAQSGELPGQGDPLLIERPAERVANFGLLLDRDDSDGLRVLGTLPGGSAERIGLRTGDRLLAANGVELTGSGANDRLRSMLATLDGSGALSLRVRRDGSERQFAGTVDTFDLPAMRIELVADDGQASGPAAATAAADGTAGNGSTCGRLSVFEGAPRSENLFAAQLIQVDGDLPGPSSQETFRVAPGKHTLTVAEAIDWKYFAGTANRQRGTGRDNRKTLEVTVEPGVTYYLAARLVSSQMSSIADGAYWEPVIWKQSPERCR